MDKAMSLLSEAKRKITAQSINKAEYSNAALVFYNIATIEIIRKNISKALSEFETLINFLDTKDIPQNSVGVLRLLTLGDDKNFTFLEIKQADKGYPNISCKAFAEKNIELIKNYLESNL